MLTRTSPSPEVPEGRTYLQADDGTCARSTREGEKGTEREL